MKIGVFPKSSCPFTEMEGKEGKARKREGANVGATLVVARVMPCPVIADLTPVIAGLHFVIAGLTPVIAGLTRNLLDDERSPSLRRRSLKLLCLYFGIWICSGDNSIFFFSNTLCFLGEGI